MLNPDKSRKQERLKINELNFQLQKLEKKKHVNQRREKEGINKDKKDNMKQKTINNRLKFYALTRSKQRKPLASIIQ